MEKKPEAVKVPKEKAVKVPKEKVAKEKAPKAPALHPSYLVVSVPGGGACADSCVMCWCVSVAGMCDFLK